MSLQQVLQFALAQRGKPYVYGATGPNSYDCSGLVQAAFKAGGYSLPRTSQEMRNAGTAVPLSQVRTGDIITFDYNDGPSNPAPGNHVALYLTAGQVVEAARPGVPIRIAPLDTAHVDRVRRITAGSAATADAADVTPAATGSTAPGLQQAGYDAVINLTPWGIPLNPFKLPGYLFGKLGEAGGDAVKGSVTDALGPVVLASLGVAAGVAVVVTGLYLTAKPTIDAANAKAEQALSVAAL
jgi:NlpC/P60 family